MTISIKPTASGATIEQDGSTILTVDGSGNLTVANNFSVTGTPSLATALTTASGSAPSYSARAWVSWDDSQTIRGSGNVSSITDNGVGIYTVNMTTAMSDTNYAVIFGSGDSTTNGIQITTGKNGSPPSFSTSTFTVETSNASGLSQDKEENFAAVFR